MLSWNSPYPGHRIIIGKFQLQTVQFGGGTSRSKGYRTHFLNDFEGIAQKGQRKRYCL
jgi:hypothetical protein